MQTWGGAASWLLRQESRSWTASCLGAGRAAALPLPSAAGGKAVWKITSSLILKVKLLYIVFKSCAKNYALILMILYMWQMVERFYSLSKKNTKNTHAKDTQVFMHHPLHWLFRFFIIWIKWRCILQIKVCWMHPTWAFLLPAFSFTLSPHYHKFSLTI